LIIAFVGKPGEEPAESPVRSREPTGFLLSDFSRQRVFMGKTMDESQTLLAQYAAGSEEAFREIVERYLDLVYSTAFRLVSSDSHLAEDIAQIVFLDLARAARSISSEVRLGGWLHRHTCFVAAKMIRAQCRREAREKEALAMNTLERDETFSEAAQILDEAINQLGAGDRAAIVLRFFEDLDLRAVGEALGSNEDAAQKRVSRALEKLNRSLTRRGVKFSAAGLATALSSQAVSAAPAGMTAKIASNVLLMAPESAGFSFLKFMAFSKTKLAGVAALLLVSVSAPLFFNRDANARVAVLENEFHEQLANSANGQQENERLAKEIDRLRKNSARQAQETSDLRNEAKVLRQREAEVKSLRQQIHQLGMRRAKDQTPWQNRESMNARQWLTKAWYKAFHEYASAHAGKLPASFDEAEPYYPTNAVKGSTPASEHFEILYSGTLQALTNLDPNLEFMLFRERKLQPLLHNYGGTNYNKMGRFAADARGFQPWGSVPEGLTDSEFSDWERKILVPPGVQ
jgi:RNA polymerase sigma factor (sigma-70 family)